MAPNTFVSVLNEAVSVAAVTSTAAAAHGRTRDSVIPRSTKANGRKTRSAPDGAAARGSAAAIGTQLAKNLFLARFAAGITQDFLAEASGVSRATVAQIESGATDCRLTTLADIAHALGISPVLLLLNEAEIVALSRSIAPAAIQRVLGCLSAGDIEAMNTLRQSGLQKNLIRVAQFGLDAARRAGLDSRGAAVGAGIGSVLLPGVGTAIGALLGAALESGSRREAAVVGDGGGI